jgi:hypothetical protein
MEYVGGNDCLFYCAGYRNHALTEEVARTLLGFLRLTEQGRVLSDSYRVFSELAHERFCMSRLTAVSGTPHVCSRVDKPYIHSSTKVRTIFRTFASRRCNHALSIDKSPEILGTAFAPKMQCADKYEGRIRALPGLCTWGYRARIRAARSFKQSPCRLDEKRNGRITPQYEC